LRAFIAAGPPPAHGVAPLPQGWEAAKVRQTRSLSRSQLVICARTRPLATTTTGTLKLASGRGSDPSRRHHSHSPSQRFAPPWAGAVTSEPVCWRHRSGSLKQRRIHGRPHDTVTVTVPSSRSLSLSPSSSPPTRGDRMATGQEEKERETALGPSAGTGRSHAISSSLA
jgi:hypothetical protein